MKYPTLSGPVLIAGKRALVRLADEDVTIEAPAPVLREIFRLCDGLTSLEDIEQQLTARWHRRDIEPLISKLAEYRVLVEADELALQSWRYVENPRRLGKDTSSQEARRLPLFAARLAAKQVTGTYRFAPRSRFRSLLEQRVSWRVFSGECVPINSILAILWAAYGVRPKDRFDTSPLRRRTVPSGGSIYPLHLSFVNMKKTGGLDEGIYALHFQDNQSIGFRAVSRDWRYVYRAFSDPEILRRAQGVIVFSGDFSLTARKYALSSAGSLKIRYENSPGAQTE